LLARGGSYAALYRKFVQIDERPAGAAPLEK
jgi:hypothetical protein